jgi:hypothetical protein
MAQHPRTEYASGKPTLEVPKEPVVHERATRHLTEINMAFSLIHFRPCGYFMYHFV